MLSWYYQLMSKQQFIMESRTLKTQSNAFYKWFTLFSKQVNFSNRLYSLVRLRDLNCEATAFNSLKHFVDKRRLGVQMKKVAAVLFFSNFLKKCVLAFQLNRLAQKYDRSQCKLASTFKLKKLWDGFSRCTMISSVLKKRLNQGRRRRLADVFASWQQVIQTKIGKRKMKALSLKNRETILKAGIF